MTVKKYVKKPIPVEAVEVTNKNLGIIYDWAAEANSALSIESATEEECYGLQTVRLTVTIGTLEGPMSAHQGDYIIRGTHGEIYPIRQHIFKETYEEVKEPKPSKFVRTDSK